jgi:EAL and modified HD-GYP domain-containing signal transduction protein
MGFRAAPVGAGAGVVVPSVLLARQPIFDPALKVAAYELFFGSEGAAGRAAHTAMQATAEVLSSAILDVGLARLAGNLPAYIKFPAALLSSPPKLPLAPERIVIEVVDLATAGARLPEGLSWLRSEGYRVALADFDVRRDNPELLDYADIVKIDIQKHTPGELAQVIRELRGVHLQLVAEKVQTLAELAQCRSLGFDLLQGCFLEQPVIFRERSVPSSRMSVLKLILSLEESRVSAEQIEKCIACDLGLSYRLLRCINSSYYRTPRKVGSMREAVLLLGYEELRRIGTILLLTSLSEKPCYLATQALVRARMCESLCGRARCSGCDGHFLAGLLSLVDVFLGAPISECLRDLPLSEPVRQALLYRQGPIGSALRCVVSYERSEWEGARFEGLSAEEIAAAYLEAVEWADGAGLATACAG